FKNRAASTGKVFIDKLVDLTVVAIFTLAGILFTVGYIQIKIISIVALIILVAIWFMRKPFSRFCEFLSNRFKIAAITKIGTAFAEIKTPLLIKIFALAFLFFAMFYFQAFVILNAFFDQPPIATILFFPLITLSTIIPVTIGGLGIREWAAALLLKQFDIPEAVAVNTFFMHFILINFIPALIGAPFVQRLIRSKKAIEEQN
ncbi:flippase-like domain-containing protein, partial [bacterium]|nr:flippase-like domain-containing protein [bacterium]